MAMSMMIMMEMTKEMMKEMMKEMTREMTKEIMKEMVRLNQCSPEGNDSAQLMLGSRGQLIKSGVN